jgi:hypothetical protein
MTTTTKKERTGNWFGTCNICKTPEQQLATVKVTTGFSCNYTILRACDDCRHSVHTMMEILLKSMWRRA